MLSIIRERFRQGHRTGKYPQEAPTLPERFRGRPIIDQEKCPQGCQECLDRCPFCAITRRDNTLQIDLGRCLFCPECATACSHGALSFSTDHRLAASQRQDLWTGEKEAQLATALHAKMLRLFGRSLKLRQVSAGGCNACEADINVLGTLVFDLGRFGIQIVASPRHADGLLVTGPVTENMRSALLDTYAAVPEPKIVIASGACAISGGPFANSPEVHNGISDLLPVDLYIPGCPPHPYTILDGLLRMLGRL